MVDVREKYLGKVTSKGQTTVPKEVRDFLGLGEGSQVEWTIDGDGKAIVRPRKKLRAVDLAGILGPSPVGPVTVEEMNEAIGDAVVERFERSIKR
jgi:AbrB family looped-hinge helix DNA binding protein